MRVCSRTAAALLLLALNGVSVSAFQPQVSSRRRVHVKPLKCHHEQQQADADANGPLQSLQLRLPRVPVAALTVLALNVLGPLAAIRPAGALPQTAPEVNPQKLLINALPTKNPALLDLASSLARITTEGSGNIRSIDAKGFKGIKPWPEVVKAQRAAAGLLAGRSKDLLAGVKPANEKAAQAALESLKQSVEELGNAAEVQDRYAAVNAQVKALKALDQLGTLEVPAFPFTPTGDYKEVPRLLGRAEVEFTVKGARTGRTGQMHAILDGFSAPLTAGHFADLVAKGAFDSVKVTGTDESSVSFAANGKAPARKIPLEILVAGDKEPSYGETLEEQGLYQARPVLPFSAYGTMAMLHPPDDPNGGSTAAFWLKADPSYTPAGLNTLDGAFAVFGYVVDGQDLLDELQQGDVIESAKLISGSEYLKQP